MNMIFNARVAYKRLAIWTRAYIISRYTGIGSFGDLFGRLYYEIMNIGDMLEIIFGHEFSEQFNQIVSEYAAALQGLISAQLKGNAAEMNQYLDQLNNIIVKRSESQAALNPYWYKEEWISLLTNFINLTIEDANAFSSGDYSKDIELYDNISVITNAMGDAFAQGLFDYITAGSEDFNQSQLQEQEQCITLDQMNAIFNIRMFWLELVNWTRSYMLSRFKGVGDPAEVYERLKKVPDFYLSMLKQVFGDKADADAKLLDEYITLIDALLTAQMNGDSEEISNITKQLYQNADKRAAYLASINPFWSENEWRIKLYGNLRSTIDESTALLSGDYARSIDIFSRLLDQAESTANYYTQGLFQYVNQERQNEQEKSLCFKNRIESLPAK
jgi:hypothetical protein